MSSKFFLNSRGTKTRIQIRQKIFDRNYFLYDILIDQNAEKKMKNSKSMKQEARTFFEGFSIQIKQLSILLIVSFQKKSNTSISFDFSIFILIFQQKLMKKNKQTKRNTKDSIFKIMQAIGKVKIQSKIFTYLYFLVKFTIGLMTFCVLNLKDWSNNSFREVIYNLANKLYANQNNTSQLLQFEIIITIVFILLGKSLLIYLMMRSQSFISKQKLTFLAAYFYLIISSLTIQLLAYSSIVIKYWFNNNKQFLGFLGSIFIVSIIGMQCFFDTFYTTFSLKAHFFSNFYNRIIVGSKLIINLMVVLVCVVPMNEVKVIGCFVFLIANILILNVSMNKIRYTHSLTCKLIIWQNITNISSCIIILLSQIFSFSLLEENLLLLILFQSIVCHIAVCAYLSYRNQKLVLREISQIKSQTHAFIYIKCIYELLISMDNKQILLLASLTQYHVYNCLNQYCFCKSTKYEFDPKSQFVKKFVLQNLKILQKEFNNSPEIEIICLIFRLEMFKDYPNMVPFSKKICKQDLSLVCQFGKFYLQTKVHDFIKQKNNMQSALDAERPLIIEKLLVQTEIKIVSYTQLSIKKYNYLMKGCCLNGDLQQICTKQQNLLQQIDDIFKLNKGIYKKSRQFNNLFIFYFEKIIFFPMNMTELRQNLLQLERIITTIQIVSEKQFSKHLYGSNACVIESPIDVNKMGRISRASKNVRNVFGFQRNTIIHKNINILMPQFIAEEHDKILEDWIKLGTWRTICKLKEIFCIHKDSHCFSAMIYLKIRPDINGLCFVVTILKKNDADYIIFNNKNEVEGIGSKFRDIIGQNCLHISGEIFFNKLLELTSNAKLITMKQTRLIARQFSNSGIQKLKNDKKTKKDNSYETQMLKYCVNSHQILAKYTKTKMGKIQYLILKFDSLIQTLGANSSQKQLLFQSGKYVTSDKIMSQIEFSNIENENQINLGNSSVSSSCQTHNYSIAKKMEQFSNQFYNPSLIKDLRLLIAILIVSFLILAFIFIIGYGYLQKRTAFFDLQDIIFADGSVSDQMQLSQFMYNNIMIQKQYKKANLQEFLQSNKKSSKILQDYLYSLIVANMEVININKTKINQVRLYQYFKQPMIWKFNNGTETIIEANQFLQMFYYKAKNQQGELLENSLYSMLINYPELKRINHQFLALYDQMARQTLQSLKTKTNVENSILLLLSIIICVVLVYTIWLRSKQLTRCVQVYSCLNNQEIQSLRDYYRQINDYLLIIKNTFKVTAQVNQIQLKTKFQNSKSPQLKIISQKSYLAIIVIISIILLINGCLLILNISLRSSANTGLQIITLVSSFMDTENYIIQQYGDLKAYYLISNQSKPIDQFCNKLETTVLTNEIEFNKIALLTIQLLSQIDPTFTQDYSQLLIDDICKLVEGQMEDFEIQKCKTQLPIKVIRIGVVPGMTFFQRQVSKAIYFFRKYSPSIAQAQKYFLSDEFRQIDNSMIFMFKIYQATQTRIFQTLTLTNKNQLAEKRIWYLFICIFAFLCGTVLVLSTNKLKITHLKMIYGCFLAIPTRLVCDNKLLMRKFIQILQHKDY